MKIVGRLLISLAGALAAAGVAVVGCGTTNNINSGGGTSGLGESCTRTFDCQSKYVCEQNVCLLPSTTVAPDGGTIVVGDASTAPPPGPHLGQLNESCQTTSDCQSPFECIDQSCSVVSYGLTATGNTCAECKTASDCCELPTGVFVLPSDYLDPWYASDVDGGVLIPHGENGVTGQGALALPLENIRCQDLLAFMGGDAAICSGVATFNIDDDGLASACFLYNTYCGSCGANGPWACNSGQCVYTAPCTASGTEVAQLAAACPAASRLRSGFSTTCSSPDGGTGGTCTAGCAVDADCAGKTPSDGNHACANGDAGGGNCSCYQSSCYFTCASDLDCASGKACDSTTHLCKAETCATNADCVESLRNPMATCVTATGTCSITCTKDTDCGPPSSICSAGTCMPSGCTSDLDCTTGSAHSFCVKAPAMTTLYSSAITN
jgi:hypothetical protein